MSGEGGDFTGRPNMSQAKLSTNKSTRGKLVVCPAVQTFTALHLCTVLVCCAHLLPLLNIFAV